METSEGKLNLKRAFGDSDTARKKPKLENHGEIKEEPELELDEKVSLGLDTGFASINGIVKSLKNEEASQTMLLHTGDRLPEKMWNNCKATVLSIFRMPTVQFGTYKLKGTESFEATLSALQQGYKGIDTATCYDNEKQVKHIIFEIPLQWKAPKYPRLGKLSQLVV